MADLVATLREALATHHANGWAPLVWWVNENDIYGADGETIAWVSNDGELHCERSTTALIVAAVNALPGLLDEIEAGRALIDFVDADHLPEAIAWVDKADEGRCAALANTYTTAREANG